MSHLPCIAMQCMGCCHSMLLMLTWDTKGSQLHKVCHPCAGGGCMWLQYSLGPSQLPAGGAAAVLPPENDFMSDSNGRSKRSAAAAGACWRDRSSSSACSLTLPAELLLCPAAEGMKDAGTTYAILACVESGCSQLGMHTSVLKKCCFLELQMTLIGRC